MAINYDWYQNPKKAEKEKGLITLHPRIRYNGSTTTAEMRRYIQESSSLTEGDVDAVLSALSHYVSQEMGDGRSVHLDGIGYFSPVLGTTETVTSATKSKHLKVKLKSIHFRPDKSFLRRMGGVQIHCIKLNDPLAKRLTDDEIEQKVCSYLQKHGYIQRRDLESLCSLSISTAKRHLNRLCKAGVLVNRGMRNQPLYYLKEE